MTGGSSDRRFARPGLIGHATHSYHGIVKTVISNSLFSLSLCAYFYITSLGYATLPFLKRTEVLLYPCILTLLMNVVLTALNVNLSVWWVWFLC